MAMKLEQYLEEQRTLIAKEKQKQKEALLDSLGIYEEEREATDQVFSNLTLAAQLGYASENVDGKIVFFKQKKVYPQLTDEEYEALLEVQREKETLGLGAGNQQAAASATVAAPVASANEPAEYRINVDEASAESFGGKVMHILALVVWVGGLIASIVLGRMPDKWGDMHFNFWMFLLYVAVFFVAGATYWAIGELFDNVASVNGRLYGLSHAKIKPEK